MAILHSCCGCGLAVSSAVLGVYLLVAYSIAFAIELWWLLESPVTPPFPAYLLCLGYFILLMVSGLLLHGLSVKKTTYLLIWLFMMGILLGPEAGLVLYLSIHYWRVTSMYGLIEITCWACRLIVNGPVAAGRPMSHSPFRGRKNAGYEQGGAFLEGQEKPIFGPRERFQNPQNGFAFKGEDYDGSYVQEHYVGGNEFSEFNASSFDPTVIDARLENMPYLTVRKKPSKSVQLPELAAKDAAVLPKTRSLIDFRDADLRDPNNPKRPKSPPSFLRDLKNSDNSDSHTNSLDRKIIKNKNLKILGRLSPFYSRKPLEVNIYQINPPKNASASDMDSQLNTVYSNRGMYAFDEKLKKVVYYPPEFFNKSITFRNRMDSYASSQSRSSVDTDYEDINHISDVAL